MRLDLEGTVPVTISLLLQHILSYESGTDPTSELCDGRFCRESWTARQSRNPTVLPISQPIQTSVLQLEYIS